MVQWRKQLLTSCGGTTCGPQRERSGSDPSAAPDTGEADRTAPRVVPTTADTKYLPHISFRMPPGERGKRVAATVGGVLKKPKTATSTATQSAPFTEPPGDPSATVAKRRQVERFKGPIDQHPEIGDDAAKPFRLVRTYKEPHSNRHVVLFRKKDNFVYDVDWYAFCRGVRPRGRLLRDHPDIVSGKYMLVDETHGTLGWGSHATIQFFRVKDKYTFYARVKNFCRGNRPPERLLRDHPDILSGEYKLVNETRGTLGWGSNETIQFFRDKDKYTFYARPNDFCRGKRPPELLLRDLPLIADGRFVLKDVSNGTLGQGSGVKVGFIRTSDGREFFKPVYSFCDRLCWTCLNFTEGTYATNTCPACWMAARPEDGATEERVSKAAYAICAFLVIVPAIFGPVVREYSPAYIEPKRYDIFVASMLMFIEADGGHHFFDILRWNSRATDVRAADTAKMVAPFANSPDAIFIRVKSSDVWGASFPVNYEKRILFPWHSALLHVAVNLDRYRGNVVFIEEEGDTMYDAHKADCDEAGLAWVSLRPDGPGVEPAEDPRRLMFPAEKDASQSQITSFFALA